jgi:TonB family protein
VFAHIRIRFHKRTKSHSNLSGFWQAHFIAQNPARATNRHGANEGLGYRRGRSPGDLSGRTAIAFAIVHRLPGRIDLSLHKIHLLQMTRHAGGPAARKDASAKVSTWNRGPMGEQYRNQLAQVAMIDVWKQWEGQTVNGEFHLWEYLGGSEHGAVFQTYYDDRNPKTAAIKLVDENSPNAESRLSSWQLASSLSHPNLIRIFQTGHCQIGDAKLLYVVMEYAEEDLSQIIPRRPLTENEVRTLEPALDALSYLHAKGLVHGRIKPANVMASGDQLKLSTDGLRRAGDPISDPSDYDPPETTSSPAGDVWSFGLMLVEVLTQRLPAWKRKAYGDPDVPENLPAPLLDIARHCLRRDPNRRWTVADIARRLKFRVAAQWTEQPVQRSGSPTRSRNLILVVILLLALTGFVSLKLLNHLRWGGDRLSQASERASEKALPGPRQVASAVPSKEKPMTLSSPPAEAPTVSGSGTASSGVIHQVLPDVPRKARDTIRGTVRVGIKVSVDSSGNVTDATVDSPGPSKYFANLALRAAPQWKFAPARDGSSEWSLRFEFSAEGTKAFARRSKVATS